jgi:hypothetical protein
MFMSSCAEKVSMLLLPRGRHRHLYAISALLVEIPGTWLTGKDNNIVGSHDGSSISETRGRVSRAQEVLPKIREATPRSSASPARCRDPSDVGRLVPNIDLPPLIFPSILTLHRHDQVMLFSPRSRGRRYRQAELLVTAPGVATNFNVCKVTLELQASRRSYTRKEWSMARNHISRRLIHSNFFFLIYLTLKVIHYTVRS